MAMPVPRFTRITSLAGLLLAAALGACDRGAAPAADPQTPYAGVVDSALPIDTLLARFRATIPDTPTTLTGGEPTPERLTRRFLAAISANDTATIRALVLSRAEFAWLYYPHTRYTRRPYELGPELLWIQVGQTSEKGITRLIRRYGGQRLRFEALACPDSSVAEGPNRIAGPCQVTFAVGDSAARSLQLFGSLITRDGRVKFVSYANDL